MALRKILILSGARHARSRRTQRPQSHRHHIAITALARHHDLDLAVLAQHGERGVLRSILRQAALTVEELVRLL